MAQNFGKQSSEHAQHILGLMREAMHEVPKEFRSTVINQIYLTLGKAQGLVKGDIPK